ncbi:MAG: hypothetical protein NW241_04270 [Bacteroidia bacterium]|nr:hypothetical protein [Bacteroidia bacterium]
MPISIHLITSLLWIAFAGFTIRLILKEWMSDRNTRPATIEDDDTAYLIGPWGAQEG